MSERRRWESVLLLSAAAVVFLSNLSDPLGLHQNDEDFYLGVAWDMHSRGDWILPTWRGEPAFQKPPLLYWLMQLPLALLGRSPLAARLPVALLAVACVWLTVLLGDRLFGNRSGLPAGAMVATTIGFFQYGRAGMMDVPLTFCMLVVLWSAHQAWHGSAAAGYMIAGATAAALLLKGPVAVALVGTTLVLYGLREGWPRVRPLQVSGAILLLIALSAIWPALLWRCGYLGRFYDQFIGVENLGKFQGGGDSLTGMLGGFAKLLLPWTLLLLAAVPRVVRASAGNRWLLISLVCANIAVYAIPAIKWSQYLLPSIPPLLLLLASLEFEGAWLRLAAAVTAAMLFLAAAILALAVRLFPLLSQRCLLFLTAVALAAAALCLVNGPRLLGAAAAFAGTLVAMTYLAPLLSMETIPPQLETVSRGRDLATYGVPPYRYALALGREVGLDHTPAEFQHDFERGAEIIVDETEMRELMNQHSLDPSRARMLLCWRKWRRRLQASQVLRTLAVGHLEDLTENVCVLQRSR